MSKNNRCARASYALVHSLPSSAKKTKNEKENKTKQQQQQQQQQQQTNKTKHPVGG